MSGDTTLDVFLLLQLDTFHLFTLMPLKSSFHLISLMIFFLFCFTQKQPFTNKASSTFTNDLQNRQLCMGR